MPATGGRSPRALHCMSDWGALLLDSSDFLPLRECGHWSRTHLTVHLVADVALCVAGLVALALVVIVRRGGRPNRAASWGVGWSAPLMGLISLLGVIQLMEAIVFFHPAYRVLGLLKLSAAVLTWLFVAGLALRVGRHARSADAEKGAAFHDADGLLQMAVDAAPCGMLAVNEQGLIVLKNAETARIFGYEPKELLGKSVELLVPEGMADKHAQLRSGYAAHPVARRMGKRQTLPGRRKDGSTLPLEIGLNPMTIAGQRIVLCAIVDRTSAVENARALEQKTAELERINAELDGFAAAASHDLKAPLRAILNTATWLEEDLPPSAWNDETRQYMRLLKSRAARMESLLDALLQYARAGRTDLVPEQFSVRAVIEDIVLLLGEQAERAVVAQGELPVLHTPRVPFERVLYNLISNAVKHARGKPNCVVQVGARAEGDGYIFEVTDDGPGIPPEYFESIFEVFTTLRPRDEVEGVGMGLALVKKVVESHGGRVTVTSTPGVRTTFSFYWPKTFP